MKPLPATAGQRRMSVIALFAGTLFASAALMFVLQPLFGKLLLPLLGGSPAVWNTCMVFYQGVVFAGYGYAHLLATRLALRRQLLLHLAVVAAGVAALPVGLPAQARPPDDGNPSGWLLYTLLVAVGLPLFVVSTTAPLLQKWFTHTGHHTSHDPYYLYAASNTGSLLALVSYPFVLEPRLGLAGQTLAWNIGFAGLCGLVIACGAMLWRRQPAPPPTAQAAGGAPSLGQQAHWLLLALVPSSLLLGLTNFISTDIAAVPLLWVIPLTVYLLSFILAFGGWHRFIHPLLLRLQPVFLVPFLAFAFVNPADLPYWAYLVLHVLAFFLAATVCHGELARLRPHSRHLTRYYLVMSFAGLLGGLFNTFAAPLLFNGIYEYPLMIAAALMLRPMRRESAVGLVWQVLPPVLLLAAGWGLYLGVDDLAAHFDSLAVALMTVGLLAYGLRHRPVGYGLLSGAVIALALGLHGLYGHTLLQARSFFGVLTVKRNTLVNEQGLVEPYHALFHGTTLHGAQRQSPQWLRVPLSYYSQSGPVGQLFKAFDAVNQGWTVGVVGLGAGAMTCYRKPGQQWLLYEIDPLVVQVAKTPRYFSYLDLCGQDMPIRLGDARLALAHEPDRHFDLLVLDAFSSDSVPTHLLTEEALRLYLGKLKATGLLAFHVTNRHLRLTKVLSVHAEGLGLAALFQAYQPGQAAPLVVAADWVVMAKAQNLLQPLRLSPWGRWETLPLYLDLRPWTDDFTPVVGIWQ